MKNIEETLKQVIIMNLSGAAEYYKDGEIEWNQSGVKTTRTVEFINGSIDNIYIRFYRKDGTLYIMAKYENKKLILYEVYHKCGQKLKCTKFVNGKRDSIEEWYSDGTIKAKKNYLDGDLHGSIQYFRKDGSLRTEKRYKRGAKLDVSLYDQHNILREQRKYYYNFKYGRRMVDEFKYYDKNGNEISPMERAKLISDDNYCQDITDYEAFDT